MERHPLEKYIPELSAWNNGNGIELGRWINAIGRYDHFLGYLAIIWPHFVLYDDCIFRKEPDPETVKRCLAQFHGDKTEVESLLNHLHIADLFASSAFPVTTSIASEIGQILKETWACKLSRDFPGRTIRVDFFGNGSMDVMDYQITMFQVR